MSLRRFTDGPRAGRRAPLRPALVACGLACLAACAGGPAPAPAERDAADVREVPAEAQTLYEQAVATLAGGNYVDAQLRLEAFVLEYPDFPGAHVNLAIIHARNGDDDAAEASLTDALILDPEYPPALNQLGILLRRRGEFHDAEAAYLKAIEVDPGYALAHYNLGVLNELYLRRLDAALLHFEQYQELSGADEQVEKWITDLKRRLQDQQRTANVTE